MLASQVALVQLRPPDADLEKRFLPHVGGVLLTPGTADAKRRAPRILRIFFLRGARNRSKIKCGGTST